MSWIGWKQVLEGSSCAMQRRSGTRAQGAAGSGLAEATAKVGHLRTGLQQGTGQAPISKGAGEWVEEWGAEP